MTSPRQTAVLLGAGHAHLYTIRRAAEFRRRGIDLVLITPGTFWYSGMATGMLSGAYSPAQDQIDVSALVGAGGGRYIRGRASRIDPARRMVVLETAEEIPFDVLSMSIGSETQAFPGAEEGAADIYPVKPLVNLWRLRCDLEKNGQAARRIVVVGGGASGCEIALNLRALLAQGGSARSEIILLVAGERPLEAFAPACARKALRFLQDKRIDVRTHARVVRVEGRSVVTDADERVEFDFLVNAAGLAAAALARASGLATDATGALRVNDFLQSISDPSILGGGDCIAFESRPLAKIGVYAVREGPVLYQNLLSLLGDGSHVLRAFAPQANHLQILHLGEGDGLAIWGRFYWHGSMAFRVKNFLDRNFLARSGADIPHRQRSSSSPR